MLRILSITFCLSMGYLGLAQLPELIKFQPDSSAFELLEPIDKARLYYERGEFINAEAIFFTELETQNLTAQDFLIFGNCLMARNKLSLAQEMYKEYQKLSGNEYGYVADMITSLFITDSVKVPVQHSFSHTLGVHGLSMYDGKVYATRAGQLVSYNASCPGELQEETFVSMGNVDDLSSVSFFNGGFSMIASIYDSKSSHYGLYLMQREGAIWSKPERLKISASNSNYLFPHFDESKGILYFSSDKEGGLGGFDLYLSYYSKGKFSEHVNLGSMINTPGNDLCPNTINGWLYFSSNGYPGKGGYDLYRYRSLDDFTSVVKNVRSFNSAYHDFGLATQNKDYFIGNRETNNGLYLIGYTIPIERIEIRGRIVSKTLIPLEEAAVLNLSGVDDNSFCLSAENGTFSILTEKNITELNVRVHANGYYAKDAILAAGGENEISLEKIKNVEIVKVIEGPGNKDSGETRYVTSSSNDSIPPIEQFVQEPVKEELHGVIQPVAGNFYIIVGSSKDYAFAYRLWSANKESFHSLQIIRFGDNLYRIGYFAGRNELDAVNALRDALNLKSDAWLVRPNTF